MNGCTVNSITVVAKFEKNELGKTINNSVLKMDKISFIVERLNQPPFSKELTTMSDLDSKSSYDLLDICCEIIIAIDSEMSILSNEDVEMKIQRIMSFLNVMKFGIPEEQVENFVSYLMHGDKETLYTVMHWCLSNYDRLKKRAYLAKYLMPVEISPDYLGEDLINELVATVKEMQAEFKIVHKNMEQCKSTGVNPQLFKTDITRLEQEKIQLTNKIQRLKKDAETEEPTFKQMLKVTGMLRKEQEEEARFYDRIREHKQGYLEVETKYSEISKRHAETKKQGIHNQSADDLLAKLQTDVKELSDKKENFENMLSERSTHLEKLHGWDTNDRSTTEEDVRMKREQLKEIEDDVITVQDRLDRALEKNEKLVMFRQASSVAYTKLCDRESEVSRLTEDKTKLKRQIEDKERELEMQGKQNGNKMSIKKDIKKYGAQVREKIDTYKRMREEIASLRAELVVVQRTEQILKSRDKNLEEFLTELERKKGVEGYRDTQRQMMEMAEKVSEIDQMKGATLEEISSMVEQIGREFKTKQLQLQPMMTELKALRQDYMEVDEKYQEAKNKYDKVTISLDMDKQALEKDCDACQEECLRAESRYHILNNLVMMARIRVQRAEQEKKWNEGNGRMLRDFASFKELYAHKITQQDHLTKQLRKQEKELNENGHVLTNQKTNFVNLHSLLKAKLNAGKPSADAVYLGNANVMSFGDM